MYIYAVNEVCSNFGGKRKRVAKKTAAYSIQRLETFVRKGCLVSLPRRSIDPSGNERAHAL